jgi:hypothetical protein
MSEEKKGCKKRRRSSHGVRRNRSKAKGNRGGRNQYATLGRTERLLARAIDRIPSGRTLDRAAEGGQWWNPNTGRFQRPKEEKNVKA